MVRYLGYSLLTVVVVIAAGFLTQALQTNAEYRAFVAAAAHVGWVILICAIVVLVADIAAMGIYTIRRGKADEPKGAVTTAGPLPLSLNTSMGRSRRKNLGSKSEFISMESLVTGSATFAERMMVLGIAAVFVSFFSIFLGVGLMLMQRIVILVLIPVIPGLFVYRFAHSSWTDYCKAKANLPAAGNKSGA